MSEMWTHDRLAAIQSFLLVALCTNDGTDDRRELIERLERCEAYLIERMTR